MKKVRVNIRSVANMAAIRRETRDGREVVVVPSATLPDDVVMNDIKYPADEIANSFTTLNGKPAPFGHPMVNNRFVSAVDPVGINIAWIGAHNENARRENGRVFLDKVIDVEVANRTEDGKAVLNAIEKGEPIHTSTGLLCELEPAGENDGFKSIARNIEFDHDAILLNEDGAATPDQGVGMMVNASGEEIEVINSAIEWADRDLDWAVRSAFDALEQKEKAGLMDRFKSALMETFASMRETTSNTGDADMADDKQLEELSAKVNALTEANDKIGETLANAVTEAIKPLTDNLSELQANAKAKDEAEKTGLVAKLVKANVLDEETAGELTLNALRKLAPKAEPGKAAALNGAFGGKSDKDEFADYDLNANIEEKAA